MHFVQNVLYLSVSWWDLKSKHFNKHIFSVPFSLKGGLPIKFLIFREKSQFPKSPVLDSLTILFHVQTSVNMNLQRK